MGKNRPDRTSKPSLKAREAQEMTSSGPTTSKTPKPKYLADFEESLAHHHSKEENWCVVKFKHDNKILNLPLLEERVEADPEMSKIPDVYRHPLQPGTPLIAQWKTGKMFACTLMSVEKDGETSVRRCQFLQKIEKATTSSKRKANTTKTAKIQKKKAGDDALVVVEDESQPELTESFTFDTEDDIGNSSQRSENVCTPSLQTAGVLDICVLSATPAVVTKVPSAKGPTVQNRNPSNQTKMIPSIPGTSTAKSSSSAASPLPGTTNVKSRTIVEGRPTDRLVIVEGDHIFPFELDGPTKKLLAPDLFGPPIFVDEGFLCLIKADPPGKGTLMRDLLKRLLGITKRNLTAGRLLYDVCQRARARGEKPPGINGLLGDDFMLALKNFAVKQGQKPGGEWISRTLNGWKDEMFAKFEGEDAAAAEAAAGTVNDKL